MESLTSRRLLSDYIWTTRWIHP